MADDRATKIYHDQIADGTLTPDEFDTTNSPTDGQALKWEQSSGKMKWDTISPEGLDSFCIYGARDSNNTSYIYLRNADRTPYNLSQFIVPYDATIIAITASCYSLNNAWIAEVRKDLNSTPIASLSLTNSELSKVDNTLSVDVSEGDKLSIYCNGNRVRYPLISVFIQKR
jgi:hypothetical protein